LLWLSIDLNGDWLETLPEKNETHWSPGFFHFLEPLHLVSGSSVEIRLKRPSHGSWSWQIMSGKEFRTHSTFVSNLRAASLLRRSRRTDACSLNEKGLMKLRVLSLFQQEKSNEEIAKQLMHEFQSLATPELALDYVRLQATTYVNLDLDDS